MALLGLNRNFAALVEGALEGNTTTTSLHHLPDTDFLISLTQLWLLIYRSLSRHHLWESCLLLLLLPLSV